MKKISLLFFLFLFGAAMQLMAQDPSGKECTKFHIGTFYFKGIPNVIITRDATTQTEYDPTTGRTIKMSVVWTSDCTYELRLIKANKKIDRKAWRKMKVLVVIITDVEEDRYQFSASSPALAAPVKGTIIRKN